MSNADQFAAQLAHEFKVTVPEAHLNLQKAVTLRVLGSVIGLSAVDTGRLRNNWQLGVGSPSMVERGPGPGMDVGEVAGELDSLEPFQTSYVSNPLEYASYLEDGTPKMAAQPMVRPTIAAVEAWADAQGKR